MRRARLLALWGLLGMGGALAATAPDLPADYFTREVKPLNVTPATDADNSYSDVIGPDGGQLTTLDAAGNTYTLTVPKGALGFSERLTMTPLTALKGMSFKGGVNAGVQLEPEGTFFVRPVTLEVEFADKPNLKAITPFNYTGAGQDFTTIMLMHDPGHYVFLLNHFSGAGFANSTESERTAALVHQPLADEERIDNYVQRALGAAHKDAVRADELGQEPDKETQAAAAAASSKALAEYEKQVLEPLSKVAAQSCTVGNLFVQKALGYERKRQLLGVGDGSGMAAYAKAIGGAIANRCLDEEAQSCYRTGDLLRFATWYLGMERQAQLMASTLGDEFNSKFNKAYNACAHFEVQFNATLTQKDAVDTTQATGGFIAAKGKGMYSAVLTSILPVRSHLSGGLNGILSGSGLPRGDQPLPYASYAMSMTEQGQIALAQTNSGTVGLSGNCAESGTGTTPGLIAAILFPAFKAPPPRDINAADPSLDGLSSAQKRDVIRVLRNTPRMGLMLPPRELDLTETRLIIGVGKPTEHVQGTCSDHKTYDATTWLESWNEQLKEIGKGSTVSFYQNNQSEPAWELSRWQPATAFPIKVVQNISKVEGLSDNTYDETWHLDITVVHTPKEDQ